MISRARGIAISTVGYLCLAIGGWMLSMTNAAWYSRAYSAAILLPLAIVLAVMGILAFVQDRALDAVVFFGGGALFGSIAAYIAAASFAAVNMTGFVEPLSYIGWFACAWAVYFLCAMVGSVRTGAARTSFLGGMFVTLGCLAIAGWSGVHGWAIVGGYLGLITSLIALGTAGSEARHFGQLATPHEVEGTQTTTTTRPMAAD